MEREGKSWLQQTLFYCKEIDQRNTNANESLPSTYKLPLKGEWTVYASGEANDSKGNANAFNAAIEHADGLGVSTETANAEGVKSEGRREGVSESEGIDETGSDTGQEVERIDPLNELTELLTMTVEPYVNDGDRNACVCIGGTRMWPGNVNGLGS